MRFARVARDGDVVLTMGAGLDRRRRARSSRTASAMNMVEPRASTVCAESLSLRCAAREAHDLACRRPRRRRVSAGRSRRPRCVPAPAAAVRAGDRAGAGQQHAGARRWRARRGRSLLHNPGGALAVADGLIYAEAGVAVPEACAASPHCMAAADARVPGRHSRHDRRRAGDERRAATAARPGTTSRASRVLQRDGTFAVRTPADYQIGYRSVQRVDGRAADGIFTGGLVSAFRPGDRRRDARAIESCCAARIATQPLDVPNAGSVFRNPPGDHAARLIESCWPQGLRHRRRARVGEARELHRESAGQRERRRHRGADRARAACRARTGPASISSRKCGSSEDAAADTPMSEFGKGGGVCMGGPSAEREISLLSGNARARRRCASRTSTRIRSIRPSARSVRAQARRLRPRVHRAARPLRRGRHGAGRAAKRSAFRTRAAASWPRRWRWTSGAPSSSGSRAAFRRRAIASSTRRPTGWRSSPSSGLPLIVKPRARGLDDRHHQGRRRSTTTSLRSRTRWPRKHDELVLVEEFVAGPELTASILGERALPLIRIEAPQGNYDYHNKYFSDETKYFCPCGLARRDRAARSARSRCARFDIVGCTGWGRLDLILRSRRRLFVPRGEHVARHDRPQPGADGGASRPACRFAELCVEILRGAHVG